MKSFHRIIKTHTILSYMLVVCLLFANTSSFVKANETNGFTNPIVQESTPSSETGFYEIDSTTRFLLEDIPNYHNNTRLQEVIALVNSEWMERNLPNQTPKQMLFTTKEKQTKSDIFIVLDAVENITSNSTSKDTYKIEIHANGILLTGASENAVLYGLRTIQQLLETQQRIPYQTIVDYPNTEERRLHVDCGRKYFSKDWFIQQIREMSYLKMNALQMHFSENMGFRIECESDPAIVSSQHLTKNEVREIIEEGRKYGVKIIPSLDTPGHVEQILKVHPEFGQRDIDGNHSTTALDITNPDAVAYIKTLYKEYIDLFQGSSDFHIGADEYMEFDRPPFTTKFKPVLNAYAKQTLGQEYIWKDALAQYINEIAELVYENGMKPRVWNDGLYYGEHDSEGKQKVETHKYIGVDFWSQMAWNPSIANLQTIVNHGHQDIYNVNASFFYYVLRPTMPDDGRPQHSFDVKNQDRNIYENWTLGKFQQNTVPDDSTFIKGASMAIWCDKPDLVDEDTITIDIEKERRALASKAWNQSSNQILNYDQFLLVNQQIQHVSGYEKGSSLTPSGTFQRESILLEKQQLQQLIETCNQINVHSYTQESVQALLTMKQQAIELLQKDSISLEELQAMKANLQSAIDGLIAIKPATPSNSINPSTSTSTPTNTTITGANTYDQTPHTFYYWILSISSCILCIYQYRKRMHID